MEQLGLFAKFWEPGKVKTRLAATLGAALACQIYESFLFHLIGSLTEIGDRRTVVYSPPERGTEFQNAIDPAWQVTSQSGGDLGNRMRTFVESCLPKTAGSETSKVVLIGADCPQLTPDDLQVAFDRLNQHDVVLGPSTDGGYYLLGIRDHCPPGLFSDVPWSTPEVLKITVDRLHQQSLRFTMLDEQTDVDDEASLRHLLADARQPGASLDSTLNLRLQQIEQQLVLAGHAFP